METQIQRLNLNETKETKKKTFIETMEVDVQQGRRASNPPSPPPLPGCFGLCSFPACGCVSVYMACVIVLLLCIGASQLVLCGAIVNCR
jgi:hypothetical protein